MPSYFFHIVFDLDGVLLSDNRVICHTEGGPRSSNTISDTAEQQSQGSLHRSCAEVGVDTRLSSPTVSHDWRYDKVSVQNIKMQSTSLVKVVRGSAVKATQGTENVTNGMNAGLGALATKGRYEPLDPQQEELGWGVVRLYRDVEETVGLYDEPGSHKPSKYGRQASRESEEIEIPFRDEECTTLCILAVPSYLTPSDFLGYVGEKTRDEVSHFRMIRTERGNRYMVLMKFRNGKKAREWRRAWNGKPFDGMEVSYQSYCDGPTTNLYLY